MRGVRGQIILLLALTGMVSCSSRDKVLVDSADEKLQQAPPSVKNYQQPSPLRKKVASLLEKRNYRRAIELMGDRNQLNRPVAGMEKEYILAVNGLLEAGEAALNRGDCAVAGHAFKWALDAYPAEPSLRRNIRWNPKKVKKHMETCSNRLMDQGLQEYRRGDLESAIRTWKGIIAFNAGHKEARKAIETATIQMRSLQNLDTVVSRGGNQPGTLGKAESRPLPR